MNDPNQTRAKLCTEASDCDAAILSLRLAAGLERGELRVNDLAALLADPSHRQAALDAIEAAWPEDEAVDPGVIKLVSGADSRALRILALTWWSALVDSSEAFRALATATGDPDPAIGAGAIVAMSGFRPEFIDHRESVDEAVAILALELLATKPYPGRATDARRLQLGTSPRLSPVESETLDVLAALLEHQRGDPLPLARLAQNGVGLSSLVAPPPPVIRRVRKKGTPRRTI